MLRKKEQSIIKNNIFIKKICSLLRKWRYYSLPTEDYKKSMEREFPKNLYSLWFISLWFAIFSFVYFSVYFFIFSTFLPIFITLSVCAGIFSVYAHVKYTKHLAGQHPPKSLVYFMIILIYIAVMSTGLYISMYLNANYLAVIFMVLLATSSIFMFASPIFTFMLVAMASMVFIALNLMFEEYPIRGDNILMLSPVAPIGVFFTWFSNRYRILLSFTTLKVEEERDKYQAQSTIDELTQLGNRRDFEKRFERYLKNYRVNEKFVCLAIMDIDYFKKYNDFYGHPKGDECLRAIGAALAGAWNNSSIYAARIGGEEFALLWLEEDMSNVKGVILQVQERIRDLNIEHEKSSVAPHVTFSIGMYIKECGESGNMQDIYNVVDTALYDAKGRGRNNAVILYKSEKMYIPE